jgi:hypothetical protein
MEDEDESDMGQIQDTAGRAVVSDGFATPACQTAIS